MQASTIVGTLALLLAALLIAGYAHSQDAPAAPEAKASSEAKTMQSKVEEREAIRRAAVAEQQKRREEFNRRCSKPLKTAEELQECRAVYRQVWGNRGQAQNWPPGRFTSHGVRNSVPDPELKGPAWA